MVMAMQCSASKLGGLDSLVVIAMWCWWKCGGGVSLLFLKLFAVSAWRAKTRRKVN